MLVALKQFSMLYMWRIFINLALLLIFMCLCWVYLTTLSIAAVGWMNGRACGGKRSWSHFSYYFWICLEGQEISVNIASARAEI
jgi:hypothetical protein